MKPLLLIVILLLAGCAAAQPKSAPPTVVILGDKTTPARCPSVAAERARAAKWKAYAKKLEQQLGIQPSDKEHP